MKNLKKGLSIILCVLLLCALLPMTVLSAGAAEADFADVGATSGTTGDCTWTFSGTTLTISGNGRMGDYYYKTNSDDTNEVIQAPWYGYRYDIKNLIINEGVTYIGNYAFNGLAYFTSITMPNSVTEVGKKAFQGCSKINAVYTKDINAWCNINFYGSNSNPLYYTIYFYYINGETNELITSIPSTVTAINNYSLCYCYNIINVVIPDGVTKIGDGAFMRCDRLSSITIPNSVKSIGKYAFEDCDRLKSITLPASVNSIGYDAFWSCSNLEWINIMNPNCTILDNNDYSSLSDYYHTIPVPTHICCESGSTAAQYAKSNGNTYGHKWNAWETDNPTCTETGLKHRQCSTCGEIQTNTIPATGHTWSEWEIINKPTCTETGLKHRHCTICDEVAEEEIPALGHDMVEDFRIDANCTEDGAIYYQCSRCGELDEEEIPALGHDFSAWEATKEATCTEKGEEKHVCSRCHLEETRAIEVYGHDYSSVVTPPTCTEGGYTTHTCSRCGDVYIDDEVEALGHTNGAAVIENHLDATCTADGGYDTVVYCTVCGDELSREHTVIEALGHDYGDWTTVSAPSCTVDGEEKHTCSRCGRSETRAIVAIGHDYNSVVTEATCTDGGCTTHTCSHCGDIYIDNEVEALGHNYTMTVRRNASLTQQGAIAVKCERCGLQKNVALPKLSDEDYTLSDSTATCTESGTVTYTWKDTTYGVYSVDISSPAKGHTVVIDPAVPADCTHEGHTEGSHCSVCGDVIIAQQTIPALGHIEETVHGHPATYDEDGLTDGVRCTRCGEWLTEQQVIPRLHMLGDVDGDCSVTTIDATYILRYNANMNTPITEEIMLLCGDVDGNGAVDIVDATYILRFLADIKIPFPIGEAIT